MISTRTIASILAIALTSCASVMTEVTTEPDVFRMAEVCRARGEAGKAAVVRLYGGTRGDGTASGQSLASDGAGGFVIGGITQGLGSYAGNADLLLAKIGNSGQIQWVQAFGGPQMDIGKAFLRTADVGHIQAGDSYGHLHSGMAYVVAGGDTYRPMLVKTGADGQYEWHKLYWTEVAGEARGSNLYSVLQSDDGGYLFSGSTAMNAIASGGPKGKRWSDVLLAKVDAEGNPVWARSYGAAGPDEAFASTHARDGGYVLAGYVSGDGNAMDALLLKAGADGRLEWAKTFGGSGTSYAKSVVRTGDGGYAFVADTTAFGAGASDILLVKTDANGNEQWSRTFGGADKDKSAMLMQVSDGGFLITGSTASFGDSKLDALILRTDEAGNVRWASAFGESGEDAALSAVEAPEGAFTVLGWTDSQRNGPGAPDLFLMQIGDPGVFGDCARAIRPSQSTPDLKSSAPVLTTGNVDLIYQSDSLRKQRTASFN